MTTVAHPPLAAPAARPTAAWDAWSCRVRLTLASGDDGDLAVARRVVVGLMDDVEVAASRFRDDSDLARVNAAAGRWVPVRPLTIELVEVALDAARRTGGAVDPTVGAHLRDAGYADDIDRVRGRRHTAVPPRGPRARWQAVRVDRSLGRVGVPAGLLLDLGATAKAWTADEAARRVRARTGHAALVEIGGDLGVAGAGTRPWRIDVAELAGGPAYRVHLSHGGIATSSVLARSWLTDAGSRHHLIDPRTSLPAAGPVRTATVWAPSALLANTWSTAAIVRGHDAAVLLADVPVDARLVARDGAVTTVGAWPRDEAVAP